MSTGYVQQCAMLAAAVLIAGGCRVASETAAGTATEQPDFVLAETFYSGFEHAGTTWNALSQASDARIYYVHSTNVVGVGARIFVFDPATRNIEQLADLTEISGEAEMNAIPQGKSHVNFFERNGKLYFASHVGVHGSIEEGEVALTMEGYEPYPGGHVFSYDMSSGEFEKLATNPRGEGMLGMTMDVDRGHIYGITWPFGHFVHYDVDARQFRDLGLISGRGEGGEPGKDFHVLPRELVVDPRDGQVYFTISTGDVLFYHPGVG